MIIFFFEEEGESNLGFLDPLYTLILSILVIYSTKQLSKDTFNVLIEATPVSIDIKKFRAELLSIEGVTDIHDLHVWPLKEGNPAMMAHIISKSKDHQKQLKQATEISHNFKIMHTCIQFEEESFKNDIKAMELCKQ